MGRNTYVFWDFSLYFHSTSGLLCLIHCMVCVPLFLVICSFIQFVSSLFLSPPPPPGPHHCIHLSLFFQLLGVYPKWFELKLFLVMCKYKWIQLLQVPMDVIGIERHNFAGHCRFPRYTMPRQYENLYISLTNLLNSY